MAATPFEHADQASRALRAIVTEHGPELLSSPRELGNLLADLLPDAPRISRLLVTAAHDQVARELSEHTSAGMDVGTAAAMVASSFAGATMLAPDACAWAVSQFAVALGLVPESEQLTIHAGGAARGARQGGVGQGSAGQGSAGQGSVGQSTAPMPTEPAAPDQKPPPGRHRQAAAPAGARQNQRAKAGPAVVKQGPRPAKPGWSAVISADRGYFDEVIADGALEETEIRFPGSYQQRSVRLSGTEMRIGRRSVSRGIAPEIDLSGPPADPGISHLHAVLIAQQDGTWLLLDQGSSNGTQVNGRQVASGVPVPLRDGDRISLGVWTVLTVRAA